MFIGTYVVVIAVDTMFYCGFRGRSQLKPGESCNHFVFDGECFPPGGVFELKTMG